MQTKVAVVGAGIAGTNLAYLLNEKGIEVSLFEKARGPGGRTSSRRAQVGDKTYRLDHGAQYIDVSNPDFQTFINEMTELGLVVKHGDTNVAVPAMNFIAKHLAKDIDAKYQVRVKETKKVDNGIELFDENNESLGVFDWVISTAPPKQAVELFYNYPIAQEIKDIEMKAHFAVMMISQKEFTKDYEQENVQDSILNWIGVLNRKPGRETSPTQLILHSNFKWTLEHADEDRDWIQAQMLGELEKQTGFKDDEPLYVATHRWLYGRALEPFGKDYILDEENKIALCGDWLCGEDIQAAWLSSSRLATKLSGYHVNKCF